MKGEIPMRASKSMLVTGIAILSMCVFVCCLSGCAPKMSLEGVKVAMLIGEGFDVEEAHSTENYLENIGATVTPVGPYTGDIPPNVKIYPDPSLVMTVDLAVDDVSIDDFDCLLIPGGYSPSNLVNHDNAVQFVQEFVNSGKIVATICDAPRLLIAADVASGRKITATPELREAVVEAGADWSGSSVVVDDNIISAQGPQNLPIFNRRIAEALSEKTQ